jgi:hypothetical protein
MLKPSRGMVLMLEKTVTSMLKFLRFNLNKKILLYLVIGHSLAFTVTVLLHVAQVF